MIYQRQECQTATRWNLRPTTQQWHKSLSGNLGQWILRQEQKCLFSPNSQSALSSTPESVQKQSRDFFGKQNQHPKRSHLYALLCEKQTIFSLFFAKGIQNEWQCPYNAAGENPKYFSLREFHCFTSLFEFMFSSRLESEPEQTTRQSTDPRQEEMHTTKHAKCLSPWFARFAVGRKSAVALKKNALKSLAAWPITQGCFVKTTPRWSPEHLLSFDWQVKQTSTRLQLHSNRPVGFPACSGRVEVFQSARPWR